MQAKWLTTMDIFAFEVCSATPPAKTLWDVYRPGVQCLVVTGYIWLSPVYSVLESHSKTCIKYLLCCLPLGVINEQYALSMLIFSFIFFIFMHTSRCNHNTFITNLLLSLVLSLIWLCLAEWVYKCGHHAGCNSKSDAGLCFILRAELQRAGRCITFEFDCILMAWHL